MTVKILVIRHYKNDVEPVILPLLKELFQLILKHGGYVSGETFFNREKPEEHLIISTWGSKEKWDHYNTSADVIEVRDKIDMLIDEPTRRIQLIPDQPAKAVYKP